LDHQHHVRLGLRQHGFQRCQYPRSQTGERLAGLHNVQIVIGRDLERLEHLIQHGAVLPGDTHLNLEHPAASREGANQGAQFDGFGTSAEYEEDTLHQPSVTWSKVDLVGAEGLA